MKIRNITPEKMLCVVGACPAIYETDRGTIVIIGKRLPQKDVNLLLSGKVDTQEEVIEIPRELLSDIKQ